MMIGFATFVANPYIMSKVRIKKKIRRGVKVLKTLDCQGIRIGAKVGKISIYDPFDKKMAEWREAGLCDKDGFLIHWW